MSLSDELKEYYRLVAVLEAQVGVARGGARGEVMEESGSRARG